MKKLLLGNEAIGLSALSAGVEVASGYPGTPSTEILETIAKHAKKSVYVEWSINEKSALEMAIGASYMGKRVLVTMKQVGLNVATDAIMSFSYIEPRGGLVLVVCDDPGPISSQTEQDTRTFAEFSKVICLDPSSVKEAYEMMNSAFDISEKFGRPVILRPTTRICHASQSLELKKKLPTKVKVNEFLRPKKDNTNFVIFPKLSYRKHIEIEKKNKKIAISFSKNKFNEILNNKKSSKGVITSGISFSYFMDGQSKLDNDLPVLKIGTSFPFPDDLVLRFIKNKKEIFVFEELDPYLEKNILRVIGEHSLNIKVQGKLNGYFTFGGENAPLEKKKGVAPKLCNGCPHTASFLAIKEATKNIKAIFNGDIGCYTLGNTLNMIDTCLCMGAGITMAQGVKRANDKITSFSFVGDSTFFASGITGIVNAVYNKTDIIVCILDNSITAMTGGQHHPGTGKNIRGEVVNKISIEKVLKGIGITPVVVNPYDKTLCVRETTKAIKSKGVRVLIFRAPCIAFMKKIKGE